MDNGQLTMPQDNHHYTLHALKYSLILVCRLAVSATFVFSGFVKLVDPYGTAYKIHDYLVAMDLPWLLERPLLPIALSVLQAVLEFCLGICLFFSIRRRTTLTLMIAMLLIYTPLTLWLAISDAVTDCGCFGDALHLTNWQTFGKNMLLLVLLAILWWQRKQLTRFIPESVQWVISLSAILASLFLAGVCIYGEPIIDFRPFHVGQHIPSAMQWPEDPAQTPEILDFNIEAYTEDAGINTDAILADTSYTFLLISPYLEQADDSNIEHINALCDYAQEYGYRFLCLTASGDSAIHRWQDLTGAEYPFAFMDELTLKTIARSNPALLLLHDGTIVGKWSHHTMPDENTLTGPLHTLPITHPSYRWWQKNS